MSDGGEHIPDAEFDPARCEHATDEPGWGGLLDPVTHEEAAERPENDAADVAALARAFMAGRTSRGREDDALRARVAELEAERDAYRKGFDGSEMLRKAAEAERDSLAAVIDEVRGEARAGCEVIGDDFEDYSMSGLWVYQTLSAVPSGVLAERDANKWNEGFDAAMTTPLKRRPARSTVSGATRTGEETDE